MKKSAKKKMANNKPVVGQLTISAVVNVAPDEATIPDSTRNAIEQAFAQLRRALTAFGPFVLGYGMAFVEAGIQVDVLDTSKARDAIFNAAEFEAFVRRAHDTCARALHQPGEASGRLTADVLGFAAEEGREVEAVRALFASMVTRGGAALISTEGELVDIVIAEPPEDKHDADLEIEVARIRRIARLKTTGGQYDVTLEQAQRIRVGDRIHPEGVDAPAARRAFGRTRLMRSSIRLASCSTLQPPRRRTATQMMPSDRLMAAPR